jgi:hypothetical protein
MIKKLGLAALLASFLSPSLSVAAPPVLYVITVWTGDVDRGGTDALAWIELYGSRDRRSSRLVLNNPDIDDNSRGTVSEFEVLSSDKGTLDSFKLCHDGRGSYTTGDAHWYVTTVEVLDTRSGQLYLGRVNRWIGNTPTTAGCTPVLWF